MKPEDRYHRFVRWSEEDGLYIGYCPDLYFGGVCHGGNEERVYAELCNVIRDEVACRNLQGNTLPPSGSGDYTRDRWQWLEKVTLEEIAQEAEMIERQLSER